MKITVGQSPVAIVTPFQCASMTVQQDQTSDRRLIPFEVYDSSENPIATEISGTQYTWSAPEGTFFAAGTIVGYVSIPVGTAIFNVSTGINIGLAPFAGDEGQGGTIGMVPAPAPGDAAAGKFLKASGGWAVPSGGSSVVLKTNGINNSSQTILNLADGSGISIVDLGGGEIEINATGGGGSPSVGPVGTIQMADGSGAFLASTGVQSSSSGNTSIAFTDTVSIGLGLAVAPGLVSAGMTATASVAQIFVEDLTGTPREVGMVSNSGFTDTGQTAGTFAAWDAATVLNHVPNMTWDVNTSAVVLTVNSQSGNTTPTVGLVVNSFYFGVSDAGGVTYGAQISAMNETVHAADVVGLTVSAIGNDAGGTSPSFSKGIYINGVMGASSGANYGLQIAGMPTTADFAIFTDAGIVSFGGLTQINASATVATGALLNVYAATDGTTAVNFTSSGNFVFNCTTDEAVASNWGGCAQFTYYAGDNSGSGVGPVGAISITGGLQGTNAAGDKLGAIFAYGEDDTSATGGAEVTGGYFQSRGNAINTAISSGIHILTSSSALEQDGLIVDDQGHFAIKTGNGVVQFGGDLKIGGNVGFYGTSPAAKPGVTGSKGGNAALASLLTALVSLGLLTDSTT